MIHLRRADGRNWDGILHVNPKLPERGLAFIYNPTDRPLETDIKLPLYYTGLTDKASVSERDAVPQTFTLDRAWDIGLHVRIEPHDHTWVVIRAP